ncbi:phage antirepressor KilAC domain-containing protein [Psychrobacter cryohalolentis]|uniref:phage antirepressor KilAC domain-containing protein n=1 Tax=Psychrobacter sp. D2 TaxID=2759702 RepID=UPI0015E5D804|nr:phage regulatory protein/antirepressor Ant [Psychrobacter sp. D2]MBA2057349.1 phage antirepressor KilAC domain-containing protein [Psychrobacter sp. D2]
MNALIQENLKTMSSRELAELCKKEHRHVLRDIDDLNATYEVMALPKVGQSNYTADNGQSYRQYQLSKEQTIDLITGYRADIRIRINRRWSELEEQFSQSSPVVALPDFTNPVEAARAFADQYEAKQIAQEQLAIAQPKADALDFISTAVNSLNARDTAKTLGIQPQKFNKWCIAHNWMYRDSKDKLQMCSNRLQQGFMEQRSVTYFDSNNNVKATTQPLFIAKGLTRLASIFSIVHEVA